MEDLVANVQDKFQRFTSAKREYKEARQEQTLESDLEVRIEYLTEAGLDPVISLRKNRDLLAFMSLDAARILRDWLVRVLGPAGYD